MTARAMSRLYPRRTMVKIIVTSAVVLSLAACGQASLSTTSSSELPTSMPAAVSTPSATPTAFVHFVEAHAFAPSPATLTVKVGTTVKFDTDPGFQVQLGGDIKSPFFGPDGYLVTFSKAGTFRYHSTIQAGTNGVVIVHD